MKTNVVAPIPGKILKVCVEIGTEVKRGDILVLLEAMKMENEILAAQDGKVTAINVSAGQNVNTNAIMLELEC